MLTPTPEQLDVYQKAHQAIASELSVELQGWSFTDMVSELRQMIKLKGARKSKDRTRYFARHYLGIGGDGFAHVRRCINLEVPMSESDIQLILRTLHRLKEEKPQSDMHQDFDLDEPATEFIHEPDTGIRRKLIDYVITMLNSLVGLIAAANIKSENLYDGDRMQIQASMQKIFAAFGMRVKFLDSDSEHIQPLTKKDLSDIGLGSSHKQRRSEQ
jgi:hypothetical protein